MPVPVDETPSANVVALVVTGQASHGCMDTAPALYTIRINGHLGATVLMAFPALASRRHGAHTVLTPQDAGVASATVTVGQQLGASVGTSLLNTIFTAAITSYLTAHLAAARLIGRQALTGLASHTATTPRSGGSPASSPSARSSAASCPTCLAH